MFTELVRYNAEHGHCNVPSECKELPELAQWVRTQRIHEKKGKLHRARKIRLNELEFVWDPRDSAWEGMFTELKRYKERFGHCNVTAMWEENPKLGKWAAHQRAFADRKVLSTERKVRLEELGFVWDMLDLTWETKFEELKRYKERVGNCNVSSQENPQLVRWVSRQRNFNSQAGYPRSARHASMNLSSTGILVMRRGRKCSPN